MKIEKGLKIWVVSKHVQGAADPQLQALPHSHSTSVGVQHLQVSTAAHPSPPKGKGLWVHWGHNY